jgi:hypothetical protein
VNRLWAPRRARRERDADEWVESPSRIGHPVVGLAGERDAVPLPDTVRDTLEAGLAVDLTHVRVRFHDGETAGRKARAEATGHVLSFAPGEWSPGTADGQRLIAHELAHVFQTQLYGRALASKPAAGATPFHQEVIDRWNREWGWHAAAIKPILLLCDAVADERVADIPALVDGLAKVDVYVLPPVFPSGKVTDELLTRLALLGLPALTRRVLHWYLALPSVRSGPPTGRRYFDDEVLQWEEIVDRLRARVDWRDGAASIRVIDAFVGLVKQLDAERRSLDDKAVAEDAERVTRLVNSMGGSGIGYETHPYISISRYYGRLAVIMKTAFVNAQAAIQAVLDVAAAELAARRPTRLLDELDRRLGDLAALELPTTDALEINEMNFEKRRGKDVLVQVDMFADQPGAARRRVDLQSYDVTTDGLYIRPDQKMAPRRILAIRGAQIKAMRRIYGVETDQGKTTPEAAENAAALRAVGGDGLQLTDDDDWRRFLDAKFRAHLAVSKSAEQSFDALIDLLKVYLRAFTVHSPMNIDDFGDNLLRKQFPRALTGQLVHDCGVYALRIAYMLSLLRDHPDLKLEIRFVQLPVHIGLVITSSTAPIGAYFIHNDAFEKYSQADIDKYRRKWLATDEKGLERPRPIASTGRSEDQFLGELAADTFVPLTDMPFIVSAVPKLSGGSPADRDVLWRSYQRTLNNKLFGRVTEDPKSPLYQFHLRYLKLLDMMRQHHNTYLVPFWNEVGYVAWQRSKLDLEKASSQQLSATAATRKAADDAFNKARDTYLDTDVAKRGLSVTFALKLVTDAYEPINKASLDITLEFTRHPELVGADARKASSDRLLTVFSPFTDPWWAREVQDHIGTLRAGTLVPPPYAEGKDLLGIVD